MLTNTKNAELRTDTLLGSSAASRETNAIVAEADKLTSKPQVTCSWSIRTSQRRAIDCDKTRKHGIVLVVVWLALMTTAVTLIVKGGAVLDPAGVLSPSVIVSDAILLEAKVIVETFALVATITSISGRMADRQSASIAHDAAPEMR